MFEYLVIEKVEIKYVLMILAGNSFISNQIKENAVLVIYITSSVMLSNQFTLLRLSEKGKKLELIDDVKGFQYN